MDNFSLTSFPCQGKMARVNGALFGVLKSHLSFIFGEVFFFTLRACDIKFKDGNPPSWKGRENFVHILLFGVRRRPGGQITLDLAIYF